MGSSPPSTCKCRGGPRPRRWTTSLAGYDTWCVDMETTADRTSIEDINSDIATGADDLPDGNADITQAPRRRAFLVYGISSGALRRALRPAPPRASCGAWPWTPSCGQQGAARWPTPEAVARFPEPEPAPDRPGLRAQHLHPRRQDGPRRRDRRVRRRDPGPGRFRAHRTYVDMCANPVVDPARISLPP